LNQGKSKISKGRNFKTTKSSTQKNEKVDQIAEGESLKSEARSEAIANEHPIQIINSKGLNSAEKPLQSLGDKNSPRKQAQKFIIPDENQRR
jgi:hypothetical protein